MHYGFRFILAVLATWRLTHLLAYEDGPWDVLQKFRMSLGQGIFRKLIGCFYCLSLWIALPLAFFVGGSWSEIAVSWAAISGAAILLERTTRDPFEFKFEDENNGLLRTDNSGTADDQSARP